MSGFGGSYFRGVEWNVSMVYWVSVSMDGVLVFWSTSCYSCFVVSFSMSNFSSVNFWSVMWYVSSIWKVGVWETSVSMVSVWETSVWSISMVGVSKVSISVMVVSMAIIVVVRCYSCSVSGGIVLSKEVSFSSCYLRCILHRGRYRGKSTAHNSNQYDLK